MTQTAAVIETDRLMLRRFTPDDAGLLIRLDSDLEVMKFLSGSATPAEVVRAKILPKFIASSEAGEIGYLAALEKPRLNFVGWFGLTRDTPDSSLGHLGYRLLRTAWGRGLATEGSRAMLDAAFARLMVTRVRSTVYEENFPSIRVLEKLGMRAVGRFRMTSGELGEVETFHVGPGSSLLPGEDIEYEIDGHGWSRGK